MRISAWLEPAGQEGMGHLLSGGTHLGDYFFGLMTSGGGSFGGTGT